MASVSYQIANLLEKMQSSDKDFRFMATNDLMTELQKDSIKLDDESEKKVVRMILKLLEDKNGEVQNLAVKCLGPLVNKVKETQVETIVETLCTNMISEKEQLRDISSIGLKTVIGELPQAPGGLSANICKRICSRLTTAIERQDDVSVQLEALDIVIDLLLRFGNVLSSYHSNILNSLIPQLNSQRQAVRKRTITACGNLVAVCNDALFSQLIEVLFNGLVTYSNNHMQYKTYVQCTAQVCKQSGHRFGGYIEKFVPQIFACSEIDEDELREAAINVFDSFVTRCPKEISPHIKSIQTLCVKYMSHDPNYNYDADLAMEGLDEDGEEEEENDEYSDDDDMSWKVRRAAAKCLESIICTRHDLLTDFYETLSSALISRFKEREENVKSDIFRAYIALLKQTRLTTSSLVTDDCDVMIVEEESAPGPVGLLQKQIPLLVRAVTFQMKEKSMRTRQDCFLILREVCIALPGALSNHIGELVPGILNSLVHNQATSTNMRIEALQFFHCLLTAHRADAFHPYIQDLLPPVMQCSQDTFYKIAAEALAVIQELVKVLRPLHGRSSFQYEPYVEDIYQATLIRLRATDIDQEVKEKAIITMGTVMCHFGDFLKGKVKECVPILVERMRNEITRLTAVKAIRRIASSPLKIEINYCLKEIIPLLATFLRKNQRALRLSSLQLLDVLIAGYESVISYDLIYRVVAELPPLLDESDLHIAQWCLVILREVTFSYPQVLEEFKPIVPQVMTLVTSPLLQGSALQAMLEFLKAIVAAKLTTLSYIDLLTMLLTPINNMATGQGVIHKQAFYSLAKCVSAITTSNPTLALEILPQFTNEIRHPNNDIKLVFALLVIGEIGREIDLSTVKDLNNMIIEMFSHVSEEVKSAASYALGSICIGNLEVYLPFILQESQQQPKRQYLLLHSLKEVITCLSQTCNGTKVLLPFVPAIWAQLYKHCECAEEGTRNVVAECMGKLTLMDPNTLLPQLQTFLKSSSPLTRTTVVTAVKFTISDQPSEIDVPLRLCIREFLNTLRDKDNNVRRVALVAFNSAAHNKPSLIRDLLNDILPDLYKETEVKQNLIREVEMGPFKHTVDDGLDIRKAAFECMYTILETCLDRIDIFQFIDHVEEGLKDHYDIKMLTYLMVARLAQICPGAVLQRLDKLVEPLKATCTSKVKANAVKQEYEKQDELKRSALRAVHALLSIPDADKNPQLASFMTEIKSYSDLEAIFESIQKDSSNHHTDFMMDQS